MDLPWQKKNIAPGQQSFAHSQTLERDPEVAETLEAVAECFQQLADSPPLAVEFEFPRTGLFARDPYKK
jgi:hypothetical protein